LGARLSFGRRGGGRFFLPDGDQAEGVEGLVAGFEEGRVGVEWVQRGLIEGVGEDEETTSQLHHALSVMILSPFFA